MPLVSNEEIAGRVNRRSDWSVDACGNHAQRPIAAGLVDED